MQLLGRSARIEVPEECQKKKELRKIEVFRYGGQTAITL